MVDGGGGGDSTVALLSVVDGSLEATLAVSAVVVVSSAAVVLAAAAVALTLLGVSLVSLVGDLAAAVDLPLAEAPVDCLPDILLVCTSWGDC